MMRDAFCALEEAGFRRYEISNFARKAGADRRCRQNMTYWTRGEYLGLGLGAASLVDETRFANTRDLARYLSFDGNLASIREDVQNLSEDERMEEFMFLGLRLTQGVEEGRFSALFGKGIDEVYGEVIRRFLREGLLNRRDGRVFLTERGLDLANVVMSEFMN